MDLFSTLMGFLLGTATGAAGSYFATKYTEQRQRKEKKMEFAQRIKKIEKKASLFFNEIREDYRKPENIVKREFYVLSKGASLSINGTYLVYYRDDHSNIDDVLTLMESEGVVWETTETNAIKYQFSNDFVEYIRNEI